MHRLGKDTTYRALGGAALAAAVLHGIALLWLAQGGLSLGRGEARLVVPNALTAPDASSASSIHVKWVRLATSTEAEAPVTPATPGGAGDVTERAPGDLATASPRRVDVPASLPAGAPDLAPMRYESSDSLQSSPRPLVGWVLDEEVLDGVRQATLMLQLWVSSQGRIDRVQLVRAEPPGEWVSRALANFSDTAMVPGVKDGRDVPSILMVEIVTDLEKFR